MEELYSRSASPSAGLDLVGTADLAASTGPLCLSATQEPGADGHNFIHIFDGSEIFPGNVAGLLGNKTPDGADALKKFFLLVFGTRTFDKNFN